VEAGHRRQLFLLWLAILASLSYRDGTAASYSSIFLNGPGLCGPGQLLIALGPAGPNNIIQTISLATAHHRSALPSLEPSTPGLPMAAFLLQHRNHHLYLLRGSSLQSTITSYVENLHRTGNWVLDDPPTGRSSPTTLSPSTRQQQHSSATTSRGLSSSHSIRKHHPACFPTEPHRQRPIDSPAKHHKTDQLAASRLSKTNLRRTSARVDRRPTVMDRPRRTTAASTPAIFGTARPWSIAGAAKLRPRRTAIGRSTTSLLPQARHRLVGAIQLPQLPSPLSTDSPLGLRRPTQPITSTSGSYLNVTLLPSGTLTYSIPLPVPFDGCNQSL